MLAEEIKCIEIGFNGRRGAFFADGLEYLASFRKLGMLSCELGTLRKCLAGLVC